MHTTALDTGMSNSDEVLVPIRTLLVDDNSNFLSAVTHFLSLDERLEIVGRAGSGAEAIEQAVHLQPHLILMDWSMPGINGIEATRQIKSQPEAPHIIMLTQHDAPRYRVEATSAGADGFVNKAELEAQLSPLLDDLLL